MEHILWTPALEIGVPLIDGQHRELLDMANRLMDAVDSGQGLSATELAATSLARYISTHFRDEEAYMESVGYPKFQMHKNAHTSLLDLVIHYLDMLRENQAMTRADVGEFLGTWVVGHIINFDLKLKDHVAP